MVIVLIGVSGVGKTTVGERLAADLGWPFYDGDEFHPQSNVDKMERGIPLTDADRAPWLDRLRTLIERHLRSGEPAVLACSALKAAYRERLKQGDPAVHFVYLRAGAGEIRARMEARSGHYMPVDLLTSQLEALEEPADALAVDASASPSTVVGRIRSGLGI
jgi:gluconokinase